MNKEEKEKIPEGLFDADQFWKLYDTYLNSDFRNATINAHLSYELALHPKVWELTQPEKDRLHIRGWIALQYRDFFNDDGKRVLVMQTGDVVIQQHGWDRDIMVTHSPYKEWVSGWLIGGPQSVGLFVPIFDASHLEKAILMRLREEKERILKLFYEEKACWERQNKASKEIQHTGKSA